MNSRNYFRRKTLYYIRKIFGDEVLNKILSKKFMDYPTDCNNPVTFNEKIQWIKLNANIENLSSYSDKYLVREYVREILDEEVLIPLIRVFHKAEDINFDNLPNRFIMKGTHGSGWNYIVEDLKKEDIGLLTKKAEKWLNQNYYEETGERNYKKLNGKIVIEEIIGESGKELDEYKIHCFNGIPRKIRYLSNENGMRKSNFYTPEWTILNVSKTYPNFINPPEKPKVLDELFDYASKLSKQFIFVRVDFYVVNNKIYFGELTFLPASGVTPFSDYKYDELFGSYLNLDKDILIK